MGSRLIITRVVISRSKENRLRRQSVTLMIWTEAIWNHSFLVNDTFVIKRLPAQDKEEHLRKQNPKTTKDVSD